MTTTLSSPNTATLGMDGAASLTIVMYGKATIAFTSANDDVWPSFTVTNAQSKTYGPYGINMSVVITALDGSLTYQVNGGVPGFGYDADSNITSLVDGEGNSYGLSPYIEPVQTLDPDNFWQFASLEAYGSKLYGLTATSSSQVAVLDRDTGVITNYGVVIPVTGITMIKVLSATTMLVGSANGGSTYTYYRTTNSGASWTLVLTMPFTSTQLCLHSKGLCVATINGQTVLVAGDYNINGSRTNGSTNDGVYLRRSDDLGATWTEITRWNTDGSNNNTRHIHGVYQYVPNGPLYVLCGDTNVQSAIFRWDGVTTWPVNVNHTAVVQSGGLKVVSGRQSYRAIDPFLKDGYLWWGVDSDAGTGASSAVDGGIYKISESLDVSTLAFVAYPHSLGRGQAIWFSAVLSTGQLMLLTGNASVVAGQKFNQVILSNRSWTKFKAVGAYRCTNATTYMSPLILNEYLGKIYVSCFGGSGKTDVSTVSCTVSANDFRGDYQTVYRPDTIHPVYWVDLTNGDDTNNGYKPTTPYKSIGYAVTGARMTYGARLQIIGDYDHGLELTTPLRQGATVVMNGHTREGDVTEPLVIAGNGATRTKLRHGPLMLSASFFYLQGATAQKLEWQDLKFESDISTSTPVSTNVAIGAGAHSFGMVRCVVGDHNNTAGNVTRFFLNDGVTFYSLGSIIDCPLSVPNAAFEAAAGGNASFSFENSVIFGGNRQVLLQGTGNSISFRNTISIGAFQSVVNVASGATVTSRFAIDSQFYSDQVASAVVINDQAGLTWTGEFKRCDVAGFGGGYGVPDAFDGTSTLRKWAIPAITLTDYVY